MSGVTQHEQWERFAKQQGYDLTTTGEMRTITTHGGTGPATYFSDASEHAWRGWVHGRAALESATRDE